MYNKIKFFEKKLIRNKIAYNIFAVLTFIGLFMMIGICGSFEFDTLNIKEFIIRELITVFLTGMSVFIANIFEARIYNISAHLHKLYKKAEIFAANRCNENIRKPIFN